MSDPVYAVWISAVATVVLVCVTAYYAWESRLSRRIAREQLDALIRPIIATSVVLRHNQMIYLRVANDGRSPAMKVRLSASKEIPGVDGIPPFTDTPLFKDGSACVPPGAQYFLVLGGAPKILGDGSKYPAQFEVIATYEWQGHDPKTERSVIDIGSYKGSQAAPRTEAEAIEMLTELLKKPTGR